MLRKRTNYKPKTKRTLKKYLMPCYGTRDIYNHYRKDIKKRIPSPYNINYKTHRDILDLYNKKLTELLIEGYEVRLPTLGYLFIRKKFITNDIARNKTLSDGFWLPRVRFSRKRVRIKNIMLYSFKPGGNFVRKMNKVFKEPNGHKRYFEL